MRYLTRLAALFVVGALALAGCSSGSSGGSSGSANPSGLAVAAKLPTSIGKPQLTLTDTDGQPYDLTARTEGRTTLLYFGYTHCPDVCPTTMADIAIALKSLAVVASRVTVVFVTTDPARDTPPVIKAWLAHFDSSFVGLTGSEKTIYAAADSLGVPLQPPMTESDGSITVNHGAQVIAFGPDNKAHAVFTAGAGSDGYIHDLPLIVENRF
jgi:protein SCO1/2